MGYPESPSVCQVGPRYVDYITPSGTQAVWSTTEEWWILILNRKGGMQIFVTSGFGVERSNTIIIPKAKRSIKKGSAWFLLSLESGLFR